MATTALNALKERTQRLEMSRKRARAEAKQTERQIIGALSAVGAAGAAGYVDGRLDMSDEVAGNGVTVLGVPVMPLAGVAVAVGGIAVGGGIGSALMHAGLGVGCGWTYSAAARKGAADAQG